MPVDACVSCSKLVSSSRTTSAVQEWKLLSVWSKVNNRSDSERFLRIFMVDDLICDFHFGGEHWILDFFVGVGRR